MFKLVYINNCSFSVAFLMLHNNEATPSGEKVFIRKPVNDFLSVVLEHVSHNSHRLPVIRRKSIRSLQRRPLAEKIISFKS
jgi:hypothetical protein